MILPSIPGLPADPDEAVKAIHEAMRNVREGVKVGGSVSSFVTDAGIVAEVLHHALIHIGLVELIEEVRREMADQDAARDAEVMAQSVTGRSSSHAECWGCAGIGKVFDAGPDGPETPCGICDGKGWL